jgi:hypothetical protein
MATRRTGHSSVPATRPLVAFRDWRVFRDGEPAGQLSSIRFPLIWSQREVRAECRRFEDADDLIAPRHAAPHADCGCGIGAYERPRTDFAATDFRGVCGIVTVWGRIVVEDEWLRAEHARVEALATYSRWLGRQRDSVARIADELGADLIELEDLELAAPRYGDPVPARPPVSARS